MLRLSRGAKGQTKVDLANLALKERACDAAARIPTSRWPFYGTTLSSVVASGAPAIANLTYEAERDVLFTDMSVRASYTDELGAVIELKTRVTIEYCNTTYAEQTSGAQWRYCCSGKGPMLLGVRESKKLKIAVEWPAVLADVRVEVSLNGFQGNGCCS